jgi:hypothetical protein
VPAKRKKRIGIKSSVHSASIFKVVGSAEGVENVKKNIFKHVMGYVLNQIYSRIPLFKLANMGGLAL